MKIALIFAVVAVIANLFFIRYVKKNNKTKADESNNLHNESHAFSKGYLNTPKVKQLKKSAAAELSISVEELDLMSDKEIKQLAKKQGLINIE